MTPAESVQGPDREQAGRLMRRATRLAMLVALILVVTKALAWSWSGSVAVLASLLDSLMDGVASLVTALAVGYSLRPADAEHRFGHGKAEALAGLAQGVLISVSALWLLHEGLQRLRDPQPLAEPRWAVAVMLLSLLLTLGLVLYQRSVARRTGSTAIAGDALHYLSDLATNLAILAGLAGAWMGLWWLDAVLALGVAAVILVSALHIAWQAIQLLLDREVPAPVRAQVERLLRQAPGIRGVHDLRTRQSGRTYFFQAHVELDGDLRFEEAHGYMRVAADRVRQAFPGCDVLLHGDPVAVTSAPVLR